MSLDAQDWVWNHSQSKGTARLVLLAIADKASGKDCSAYAGTTMLIQRANAARSSVIVAVDKLLDSGELAVVEGVTGPRGETRYRLPKAIGHRREGGPKSGPPQNPDRSENRTPRGTKSGPPRSENRTPTGPKTGPHNAVNADTTEGTQRGEDRAAHTTSNQPHTTRPDGRLPLDNADFRITDTMRRWAAATFPSLDVDYETQQFVSHHRAEGTRRRSWPDEWQKWIRRSAKYASERTHTTGGAVVPFRDRQQQHTDDLFDRAMARAKARMQETS
ncbi:hypothetical protein ACFUN7_24440 [Streptomyces sp. NPDC057236]|uniref:hypothetical protein n=1 Tax=Streptomyces sp. NPDC057236 TaxID=3346059 RepID=UPI003641FFEC